MARHRLQSILHRIWLLGPAMGVFVVGLFGSLLVSSCGPTSTIRATTIPQRPLSTVGVPIVRVRLTHKPVSLAEISTTTGYEMLAGGRKVASSSEPLRSARCERAHGRWTLGASTVAGDQLSIVPNSNGLVGVRGRLYRGWFVLEAAGPDSFYVHNYVDLESYVASVIACELIPGWHAETFRAQAVAARTFAMYEKLTRSPTSTFDVYDSQRSQVYKGHVAETDKSWAATRATHGWVLTYGPTGRERIILAQFGASNGGHVNGAHVIRRVTDRIPPLEGGQIDPDAEYGPLSTWPAVAVSKQDIYEATAKRYPSVRELEQVRALRVKTETEYGRPIWLELTGRNGQTETIRAEDLRMCLLAARVPEAQRLYSMNCRIRDVGASVEFYDGKGFGHGVGLSQWGAEAKAQRGLSAVQILTFYYPGAKIARGY